MVVSGKEWKQGKQKTTETDDVGMLWTGKNDFPFSAHEIQNYKLNTAKSWFCRGALGGHDSPSLLLITTKNPGLWKVNKAGGLWRGVKTGKSDSHGGVSPFCLFSHTCGNAIRGSHLQSSMGSLNSNRNYLIGQRNQEKGLYRLKCVRELWIRDSQRRWSHNSVYESTQITA